MVKRLILTREPPREVLTKAVTENREGELISGAFSLDENTVFVYPKRRATQRLQKIKRVIRDRMSTEEIALIIRKLIGEW